MRLLNTVCSPRSGFTFVQSFKKMLRFLKNVLLICHVLLRQASNLYTLPYRKNVKPVDASLFSGLKQKIYLFRDARRRQCDKFQVANTEGYNSYLKTQCQEVRVHKFPLQLKIKKTNNSHGSLSNFPF